MKHLLLTSASVLALSLHPTGGMAQTVVQDKLRFDRYDSRVDVAAAYTAVLLEANGHVRNFLNNTARAIVTGSRAGDVAAQQAYVLAIARSIEQTGQPPAQGGAYALPTYPYVQMAEFDVAHRYCGGQLVSFYDTNDFKSSLTPEQIQYAPRLQYIREGRQDSPATLYLLKTASDGSRYLLSATGQQMSYTPCIDSLNGAAAPLADDTLLTLRRVAVPFEEDSRRVIRSEYERRACDADMVGAGKRYLRETYQAYDAAGKRIGDPVVGEWVFQDQSCRAPKLIKRFKVEDCSSGNGFARYKYFLLEAQDPAAFGKIVMVPANEAGQRTSSLQLTRDMGGGVCDDEYPADITVNPATDVSTEETRALACNAVYPGWNNRLEGNYYQARTRRERKFELSGQFAIDDIHQVIYSPWEVTEDSCKMITTSQHYEYLDLGCFTGFTGSRRQRRTLRTITTDFANPATADTTETIVYSDWAVISNSCQLIPPPPPPTPIFCGLADGDKAIYRLPGQCPTHYGYTGGTMGGGGGTSSSGGGGGGDGAGSVDTNGDGKGDYRDMSDVPDDEKANADHVPGGCGACNGPQGGSSSGPGGPNKIICTAMNAAYGFGSYRQTIWLAHAARHMSVYHQTGYHLLALPLIRKAYGSDNRSARMVRKSIEHIVRERTADIRAEMRGAKRRPLGRFYRATLEPLCYALGRMAKGRSVDAIKEVPVIAAALRTETQTTKGHIHV